MAFPNHPCFLLAAGVILLRSKGTHHRSEAEARAEGWVPGVESGQKVDPSNDLDMIRWSGHDVTEMVQPDAVSVTYTPIERSLEEAKQRAISQINEQAKQRYRLYDDAVLRKARTGESFLPATQAALDIISAKADAARQAVADATSIDDIVSHFPVMWEG